MPVDVKRFPPLKAQLIYQLSSDKESASCCLTFETPYRVRVSSHPEKSLHQQNGDQHRVTFVLQNGHDDLLIIRVDHPEKSIHGCTVFYNRKQQDTPAVFQPPFNMEVEIKEGVVS